MSRYANNTRGMPEGVVHKLRTMPAVLNVESFSESPWLEHQQGVIGLGRRLDGAALREPVDLIDPGLRRG